MKRYWEIITAEILVLIVFILFFGKYGDFIVDSFREVYIPAQVSQGKLLYKDIFTIYAPFAYLFNAFLFSVFGIKLKVLYFAGLFTTMGIFYFVNKIANIFLDRISSFAILLFLIAGLVLSPNAFNSFLPYSFGILYGLFFILISIYAMLNKRYSLAYFAYSLSICAKYEFIFLLPILIFVSGKKDWLKNIGAFILPPILIFLILGISFEDVKTAFQLIQMMASTKTLMWFYSVNGLTFRLELIPIYLINIAKFIFPIYLKLWQEVIIWAFPVISFFFIFRFRILNKLERIFIISSILVSIKVFWALALQSYGVFFIPFALISLFILFPQKLRKIFAVWVIAWALIVGFYNTESYIKKDAAKLNSVIDYVKMNTKMTDRVVVYPEGLGVNVLANRKSDDKFYSLIPLYVETFGEDLIIKRLEIIKPECIIISDYDTSAYYFRQFGQDYAVNVMNWIKKNYKAEKLIDGQLHFTVYRMTNL